MKDEVQQIKSILDKSLLDEDPSKSFKEVLPKIRSYSSVDSAWTTNMAFFVKFKKGGTMSWIITP